MADNQPDPANMDTAEVPRCIECAYCLMGLQEKRCPECGRQFDLADPATFVMRPPLLRWRLWFPGLCLAIVAGVITFSIMLAAGGGIGWSITIAAPLCLGIILGYRCRVQVLSQVLLYLSALTGVIATLITLDLSGLYCAIVFFGVAFAPIIFGGCLGAILRRQLKRSGFNQRSYLPVILAILSPIALSMAERLIDAPPVLSAVETSRVFAMPMHEAWQSIRYYDELTQPKPLLFRLGAPLPTGTTGDLDAPGDTQVCEYDKGRVVKKLRTKEYGDRIVFDVIEQRIGFERSVRLVSGSFAFESVGTETTRITLRTEYDALLKPRFCWSAAERLTLRTLHEYILDGIEQNAAVHASQEHPRIAYDGG